MPDTTAPDWWIALYSPAQPDTASAGRPGRPPRIPPPGQVVDLSKPAEEDVEDAVEPDVEEAATTAPAEAADRGLGADTEPDSASNDWADIPERTAPPDQRAVLAGAARIQQAVAGVPGRLRWLTYNASAAGAGWCCHLVQPVQAFIATCGVATSDQVAAVILGASICALVGWRWDHRTRGWWGPLPWICRIPLASAVLALGLYAPGHP